MNNKTAHRLTGILGILLLAALAANPAGATQGSAPETITLALTAPAYELKPLADGFTAIEAEDSGASGQPGQPVLPHQLLDVALPPDVDWNSLALVVRDVQTASVPGTYKLRPVERALPDSGPAAGVGAGLNAAPEAPISDVPPIARLAATGQMRKWRVARIDFCPFRYDPATGQIRVVERATAELRFTRTGAQAGAELLADSAMDGVAAGQFVNYEAAQAWYPAVSRALEVYYDYAIITTQAIVSGSSRLGSFIAHKRAQGHNVWLVTEADYGGLTGQAPNGRAEKVREWLKQNYAGLGIKYVLLIGNPTPIGIGSTDLPMKQCWPIYVAPGSAENVDAPTDYFFADLTGNWDMDGDAAYGEYTGDWGVAGGVDLFPEVYVGRIPFYGDYSDLDSILQKTMRYETEGDIGWRRNILLPMSYHYLNYDFAPLAEQMWNDYLLAAGYSRWRMYMQGNSTCAANDSVYYSDEELLGDKVRDRWAAHDYGIVLWAAHGNQEVATIGWGDPPPGQDCWDGTLFHSSQAAALDDSHPAFTYQCSCDNSWPENANNLAYAILRRGGIATVGATRVSFPGSLVYGELDHDTGNAGIGYDYVRRVANGYTASEALFQARFISTPEFDQRLINFYVFNLYGDPDVRITDSATAGRAYLSIPAAAFQPAKDGEDYENHGRYLMRLSPGPEGSGHYLAPVVLPHGATITAVTFHWYDRTSGAAGSAQLKRTNRVDGENVMASADSFDEGGYGASRDVSIAYAGVDNVNYGYWVDWALTAGTPDVMGCNVTIEYISPPPATKGYLSLPAAAFKPFEDGYDYENSGRWIAHFSGPGGGLTNGWYLAPVQLPEGARVTKMTFYYYDDSAANSILARLQYGDLAGGFHEMAYVDSAGYAGAWGNRSTTAITQPVIDNRNRSYWVIWDGPVYGGTGADTSGIGVLIEYDTPMPQAGRVSVPAPAFTPFADDWQYQNHGRYLIHQAGGWDSRAHYEAPVYLPQGARVTSVVFWFNDDSSSANGYAHLCRSDRSGNYTDMAFIDSLYTGGFGGRAAATIDDRIIDNTRYAYWVYWDLPVSTGPLNNVWGTSMTIEYAVPMIYLPVIKQAR